MQFEIVVYAACMPKHCLEVSQSAVTQTDTKATLVLARMGVAVSQDSSGLGFREVLQHLLGQKKYQAFDVNAKSQMTLNPARVGSGSRAANEELFMQRASLASRASLVKLSGAASDPMHERGDRSRGYQKGDLTPNDTKWRQQSIR